MKFKNPNMFVSKKTGLPMKPPKMIQTIPKLLPKGVNAEEEEKKVQSTKNSFQAVVII